MYLYDHFPQEDLVDLLRAYDCYISTAADAGLLTTGWTPVCVEEFYENEYQNVWDPEKGDESFYYMYENAEAMIKSFAQPEEAKPLFAPQTVAVLDDAKIIREMTNLFCQFPGEEEKPPLRSRIQDIKKGDAFLVPSSFNTFLVRQAAYDAHQNLDEKDEPWIVYDIADDCWFEEDIANAERTLQALQYGKVGEPVFAGTPVNLVNIIRERPSENEEWINSFWVDAKQVPSVDLFRAAVSDFLRTKDGVQAIKDSCNDFNWGDAMLYVPQEIWKKHGIYPVDLMHPPKEMGLAPTPNNNPMTFTVDQDELLFDPSQEVTFESSLIFEDDIYVSDKAMQTADAYLWATDYLCDRLAKEVSPRFSPEVIDSMENINFYAVQNVKTGHTSLEATFWYIGEDGEENHTSVTLPLTEEERDVLASSLEAYCRQQHHRPLLIYVNDFRFDYHMAPIVPDDAPKPALADRIRIASQRANSDKAAGKPPVSKESSRNTERQGVD